MPNSKYVKGRKKEYRVRLQLLNEGYDIAQRSAGSHSPVDVFAISKEKKEILLIQCKPEDYSPDKLNKKFDWLNGNFKVSFKVV